jgi:ribonuclease VapC
VETVIVAESRGGDRAVRHTDSLFRNANVSIQPVTAEQAYIACQAFSTFGKGRHPAGLNFGDCFSYALAKSTGEPLLSSRAMTSARPISYRTDITNG